jgi:hypothetical protein
MILGPGSKIFCSYFGIQPDGNVPPELDAHEELKHKVSSSFLPVFSL